jgi:hypothetical protein
MCGPGGQHSQKGHSSSSSKSGVGKRSGRGVGGGLSVRRCSEHEVSSCAFTSAIFPESPRVDGFWSGCLVGASGTAGGILIMNADDSFRYGALSGIFCICTSRGLE